METDNKEFYFKTGSHLNLISNQMFDRCVLEQTRKRNKTVKAWKNSCKWNRAADKGVLPGGRRSIIPCAELVKVG